MIRFNGGVLVVPPFECAWLRGNEYILHRGSGCIAFEAKADNDVTVILNSTPGARRIQPLQKQQDTNKLSYLNGPPTSHNYTIIFGSHRNSCLKIERDGETHCMVTDTACSRVSTKDFQRFWIDCNRGLISIGSGSPGQNLCHQWQNSDPSKSCNNDVLHIGLSCWDRHVSYRHVSVRPHINFSLLYDSAKIVHTVPPLLNLCLDSLCPEITSTAANNVGRFVSVVLTALTTSEMLLPLSRSLYDACISSLSRNFQELFKHRGFGKTCTAAGTHCPASSEVERAKAPSDETRALDELLLDTSPEILVDLLRSDYLSADEDIVADVVMAWLRNWIHIFTYVPHNGRAAEMQGPGSAHVDARHRLSRVLHLVRWPLLPQSVLREILQDPVWKLRLFPDVLVRILSALQTYAGLDAEGDSMISESDILKELCNLPESGIEEHIRKYLPVVETATAVSDSPRCPTNDEGICNAASGSANHGNPLPLPSPSSASSPSSRTFTGGTVDESPSLSTITSRASNGVFTSCPLTDAALFTRGTGLAFRRGETSTCTTADDRDVDSIGNDIRIPYPVTISPPTLCADNSLQQHMQSVVRALPASSEFESASSDLCRSSTELSSLASTALRILSSSQASTSSEEAISPTSELSATRKNNSPKVNDNLPIPLTSEIVGLPSSPSSPAMVWNSDSLVPAYPYTAAPSIASAQSTQQVGTTPSEGPCLESDKSSSLSNATAHFFSPPYVALLDDSFRDWAAPVPVSTSSGTGRDRLLTDISFQRRALPASTWKDLSYICDGDQNGVLYYIGTMYGTQGWVNPVLARRVRVQASSPLSRTCNPTAIAGAQLLKTNFAGPRFVVNQHASPSGAFSSAISMGDSYPCPGSPPRTLYAPDPEAATGTGSAGGRTAGGWWVVNLGASHQFVLTYYSIRHDGSEAYPRNWVIQGCKDSDLQNPAWVDLRIHRRDTTIKKAGQYGSWPVGGAAAASPYRAFRLMTTGPNASATQRLTSSPDLAGAAGLGGGAGGSSLTFPLSHVELYGYLRVEEAVGVSPSNSTTAIEKI